MEGKPTNTFRALTVVGGMGDAGCDKTEKLSSEKKPDRKQPSEEE